MVYEEKDIRKAVETARQLMRKLYQLGLHSPEPIYSPEEFYDAVVNHARQPVAKGELKAGEVRDAGPIDICRAPENQPCEWSAPCPKHGALP